MPENPTATKAPRIAVGEAHLGEVGVVVAPVDALLA
jgi:hypothetical protein